MAKVHCPNCGRNDTGRVGNHEFFCWNCCLEFHGGPGHWRLFAVDTEGTLVEVRAASEPAGPPPAPVSQGGPPGLGALAEGV